MTTQNYNSDFFTAGGTLPPDAPSYVERPSDDELFQYVSSGDYCYVLTPRQMGKSSLMIRTAHRLLSKGVKSAIVDLTQIGTVDDEGQWYKGILTQIKRRLGLNIDPVIWWGKNDDIPSIQKFIEFFEEMLSIIKGDIVIFFDEIDTTLKLDFRDNFFAGIRAMYNARAENPDFSRLTFVLLGVASPSDLIKDRDRTPFNIGKEIPLRPFSRENAYLLENALEKIHPDYGKIILDRVFYWTNGHPYLTQKICQSIVEFQRNKITEKEIDLLVMEFFTSEEARRETNLQFVQDNVLNYPERKIILSLYKKLLLGIEVRDNKNSRPQNHLKLSGLARAENGKLVISNRIYSSVFNQKWVDRYSDVDWRYPIIGVLILVILAFSLVFYNDGIRLPNQAATMVGNIPVYRDDRGIEYLSRLFRMKPFIFPNEYEYKAKDVFFNQLVSWEEQRELIEVLYGEPRPSQKDYRIVISGLYTSLADVDNSGETTKMLEVIYSSLEEMDMQNEIIYLEIGYWLEARENVVNSNLESALEKYSSAIKNNPRNPATLFERARVNALFGDYENSLKDYEQAIAVVPESNYEPTEIPDSSPDSRVTETLVVPQTSISPLSSPQVLNGTVTGLTTQVMPNDFSTITPQVEIDLLSPESPAIQPRFLTRAQRIAAVRNDIIQNRELYLLYSQSGQEDYPSLSLSIDIETPPVLAVTWSTLSLSTSTQQLPETISVEDVVSYSCPDISQIELYVGTRAEVANLDVNLRSSPSVPDDLFSNVIAVLQNGIEVSVIGGPECAHDGTWWQVKTDNGLVGWVRELISGGNYLLLLIETPSVPATALTENLSDSSVGCVQEEVRVCEDVVTTIEVCKKWSANSQKCLESEQQERVDTVCQIKKVCD